MRKVIACTLCCLLGLGVRAVPVHADGAVPLSIGTTTAMSGQFGLDMFGDNASDIDVRSLLHGYPTVSSSTGKGFYFDETSLASVSYTDNADASRTYTMTVADGLTYNDGTPITAVDYVFSVLLSLSPEIAAIGGRQGNWGHLVGGADYRNGDTPKLAGLRLLSPQVFSMQILSDSWPMFYGMATLKVFPLPIGVLAPSCTVRDDGDGAYIDGDFSEDVLHQSILDPDAGYLYNPRVTSGPYKLDAYDPGSKTVSLSLNLAYIGTNCHDQPPSIQALTFTTVSSAGMLDRLESGEIDLLNKVTDAAQVQQGQSLSTGGQGFTEQSYLRDGLTYLAFDCGEAPLSSLSVREAIGMALDRDGLVDDAGGYSAKRVYGYYGLGQWMTSYALTTEDGKARQVSDVLSQLDISYDPEGAAARLDADGWTLNAGGDAYAPGDGAVRYKEIDGELVPLALRWAKTSDSGMANAVEEALTAALLPLGFSLTVDEMPFEEVLPYYYRQQACEYNLYFVGSNFMDIFDPSYEFNTGDLSLSALNLCALADDTLASLAHEMRLTSPSDEATYVGKWLQYQIRFMEQLPLLPLYSNIYFDFYTDKLDGYDIENHASWGEAILCAQMQE